MSVIAPGMFIAGSGALEISRGIVLAQPLMMTSTAPSKTNFIDLIFFFTDSHTTAFD